MENPLSSLEEIIHRVQSFLDGKAAAQTSTLSKLWYCGWRTRPDLDFRRHHFPSDERLLEFATKTLERYEQLNHKIGSFNLHMPRELYNRSRRDIALVNDLIIKAMKLGAVVLSITLWEWNEYPHRDHFTLPDCVLQSKTLTALSLAGDFKLPVSEIRSETLASLSLTGSFGIGLKDLTCPKLKTLGLSVAAADADFLRAFFSRFPELERMKLDEGNHGLAERWSTRRSAFYLGSKDRSPFSDGECEYYKLKYMHLEHLEVDDRLFSPKLFSSKFPFLKELVIWDCKSLQTLRIRSESLEHISIGFCNRMSETTCYLVFEVPNIRKFRFEGSPFSCLDFRTTTTTTTTASREFESDIHATCDDPSFEWFISLNTFLTKLSLISKVSLSITNPRGNSWSGGLNPVAVGSRRPRAVECLRIGVEGVVSTAFLDSLILICRPKFLVHEDCKEHDFIKDHLLELASKRKFVKEVNAERVLEDNQMPWNYSTCTRRLVQWGMVYKHRN